MLETIQEDMVVDHVGGQSSYITPSHLNTPRRGGATPISASPKYFRHHTLAGTTGSLLMSQNLMYGLRSPTTLRSRTSLHSRSSAHDDVTDPDAVSHIQVRQFLF